MASEKEARLDKIGHFTKSVDISFDAFIHTPREREKKREHTKMTIDYSKWDKIECSSSDSEEANTAEANDDYYDDDVEGEEVVERDAGEKKNDEKEKEPTKRDDEKRDALHENYDVVVGERLFKEDEKLKK